MASRKSASAVFWWYWTIHPWTAVQAPPVTPTQPETVARISSRSEVGLRVASTRGGATWFRMRSRSERQTCWCSGAPSSVGCSLRVSVHGT